MWLTLGHSQTMGAILDRMMFPGKRSYTSDDIPSPPLVFIAGVPCLRLTPMWHNKVVLYMHGNGEDLGTLWRTMGHLAEQLGAIVYCMEYRGYGIHDTHEPKPSLIVADGARVLRNVARTHGTQVHLVGYSIGTAVATAVAARTNDVVGSLSLFAPFYSPHALVTHHTGSAVLADMVAPADHALNTAANIALFHSKVLILHGTDDDLIPIDNATRLLNELGSNKVRLVSLPNEGHILRLEDHTEELMWHMTL